MITEKAEQVIQNLPKDKIKEYTDYWESITPSNLRGIFERWLFAQLSVHTAWSMNVSSYLLLKSKFKTWINDRQELGKLLIESKVGIYKRREEGIWNLSQMIFQEEDPFKPKEGETWIQCRNRLMANTYGLGFAKTAFALEMCFPTTNDSVCLDTHMLQLYGYSPKEVHKANHGNKYIEIENHWRDTCRKNDVAPYIARCLFWDTKQKQQSSKYWSYVFE